jgi:hypothetical protein
MIFRGLIKALAWVIRQVVTVPQVRYSNWFYHFEGLFNYYPREEILKLALRFVKMSQLYGDYLEFGVFEGQTFQAAYHLAQRNGLNDMLFYAFDSFEGLPEPQGQELWARAQFKKGDYSCSQERFLAKLAGTGADSARVVVVPGWFDQVLVESTRKQLKLRKAAVVWVDCDLYESTVPVLEFIRPYLQDGTILIFDDWFCFKGRPDRGEQLAVAQWLMRNPQVKLAEFHKFGWHGNSFVVSLA